MGWFVVSAWKVQCTLRAHKAYHSLIHAVHSCVCACVCVCVSLSLCVCTQRPEVEARCLSLLLSMFLFCLFLRHLSLSPEPRAHRLAGLGWPARIWHLRFSAPPTLWLHLCKTMALLLFLNMDARYQPQVLMLAWQALYQLNRLLGSLSAHAFVGFNFIPWAGKFSP